MAQRNKNKGPQQKQRNETKKDEEEEGKPIICRIPSNGAQVMPRCGRWWQWRYAESVDLDERESNVVIYAVLDVGEGNGVTSTDEGLRLTFKLIGLDAGPGSGVPEPVDAGLPRGVCPPPRRRAASCCSCSNINAELGGKTPGLKGEREAWAADCSAAKERWVRGDIRTDRGKPVAAVGVCAAGGVAVIVGVLLLA
jgi:hypothetical protein